MNLIILTCMIEGDSKTVIKWDNGDVLGYWRLDHFIQEIRVLIAEVHATLTHIPCFQNSIANYIAKWSARQQANFEDDHTPGMS